MLILLIREVRVFVPLRSPVHVKQPLKLIIKISVRRGRGSRRSSMGKIKRESRSCLGDGMGIHEQESRRETSRE